MQNISAFGFVASLKASNTFPNGFTITQWADDADPFDAPSIQLADKSMGINGDLIHWSKPNAIVLTINVLPGGVDDVNLSILAEANRVAKNKGSARDIITISVNYPDGRNPVFAPGIITDGVPSNSVSSAGRMKTKAYTFAFENKTNG
jgi:hypothetical protein